MSKFHVIIVAAGRGSRFGGEIPKQYLPLAGQAVLRHSITTFLSVPNCVGVHVAIHPSDRALYDQAVLGLDISDPVIGGNTRRQSVLNALQVLKDLADDDVVLIHDGARPLIDARDIQSLLDVLKSHPAASLCSAVSDTLRYGINDFASDFVERSQLRALQTPQGFHYGVIKRAHAQASQDVTDDTALVSLLNVPVKLVQAHFPNAKITTAEDLMVAQALLSHSHSFETRIGSGFDVHGFDEVSATSVRLCGLDIPFTRKLAGHSDADVGLHALTDAILGAIGEGDIGLHFPPSDMTFKNMDSAVFLQKAMAIVADKGARLLNADLTLICEAPKITPHRDAMRLRVADILGVAASRVNIKATTTERLGFTGRGEGIAAQASVSVAIPVREKT